MAVRFGMPIQQLVNDSTSDVAAGWKLNFYVTATTTRKDTFSDNALTTANANPVVADSAGRFGDIFLESGTYKVVLTDADDVEKWTADPVTGSIGTSGEVDAKTAAYTVTLDDNTKIIAVDATTSAVTITLPAAATAGDGFDIGVKKTDSSVNAVTIDADGAELVDGTATYVLTQQGDAALLRCDGSAWQITSNRTQLWTKGADIASPAGGALALGRDGNYFDITGTNTITSINTVRIGHWAKLHFDGALTLTHHATDLVLPGGLDILTIAGDEAEFVEYATGDWRCVSYQRYIAQPTNQYIGGNAAEVTALDSSSTAIPYDDTTPESGEGEELITVAYAPKYATSVLEVEFSGMFAGASSKHVTAALFKDSDTNAIDVNTMETSAGGATFPNPLRILHRRTAGGTSSITFKVRYGAQDTTTVYCNGDSAGRKFGGIAAARLIVREYL